MRGPFFDQALLRVRNGANGPSQLGFRLRLEHGGGAPAPSSSPAAKGGDGGHGAHLTASGGVDSTRQPWRLRRRATTSSPTTATVTPATTSWKTDSFCTLRRKNDNFIDCFTLLFYDLRIYYVNQGTLSE
ncbi:hypothetical protein PAHAL_6G253100 [Panicum hallii]|uniref:Uncharacterized protein n=1 Tax=Panicum hallii TaxID=206008 RepID=A0A2T8IHG7_9POAL|nr:hypothetical protein PAHAL_6G253100 [Panicum hallii]